MCAGACARRHWPGIIKYHRGHMTTNTMIFKALTSLLCGMTLAFAAMNVQAQGNGSAPGLLSPEAGPSSPTHPGRGVVRSQRVAPDKGLLAQLRAQLQNKPNEPQTLVLN